MSIRHNQSHAPVYKSTEITTEGSTAEDDCPVLTCTAVLPEKLKELLSFIKLEWVGPYGVALTANNFIVIGSQTFSECETSSTLTICPLKTSHAGLYRCIINISKPSLSTFFQRELRQQVSVTSKFSFVCEYFVCIHMQYVTFDTHIIWCCDYSPCSISAQALFQLQFGPVAHCATWYKDQVCMKSSACVHCCVIHFLINRILLTCWSVTSRRHW